MWPRRDRCHGVNPGRSYPLERLAIRVPKECLHRPDGSCARVLLPQPPAEVGRMCRAGSAHAAWSPPEAVIRLHPFAQLTRLPHDCRMRELETRNGHCHARQRRDARSRQACRGWWRTGKFRCHSPPADSSLHGGHRRCTPRVREAAVPGSEEQADARRDCAATARCRQPAVRANLRQIHHHREDVHNRPRHRGTERASVLQR